MKAIIFAVVCLAATVTAADVCSIECTETSGNWTGNTSVVVELGQYTEIVYDVNFKIVAIVNTQQNLVFATNGKFFLVLNIKTGGYLLIDVETNYAIYGEIKIDFLNYNGSVNYTKLIFAINGLFSKYESITSSTSSSFNFGLIITSFYNLHFDLTVILQGCEELVTELNASFNVWFRMIREEIIKGSLQAGRRIWGFFVVIFGIDIEVGSAFLEIIRTSVEHFGSIETKIMVEVIKVVRYDIRNLIQFSIKFTDISTTTGNASVEYAIEWITDVSNDPVSKNLTVLSRTYTIVITKIDSQYVIRFTMTSSAGARVDIKILYVQGVLLIINERTNTAVALYERSFVLLNVIYDYALVGTSRPIVGLRGKLVAAGQLAADINSRRYSRVAAGVKALIRKHGSTATFTFVALHKAVMSGSVSQVGAVVGSAQAKNVIVFYGAFFAQTSGGSSSFAGVIIGVFSNRSSALVVMLTRVISTISTTTQNWFAFIQFFLRYTSNTTSSSTVTYGQSYSYQISVK